HVRVTRVERACGAIFTAQRVVRTQWQPDFRPGNARAGESLSRHTDDRELLAVDAHHPAERVRIGAELLPERIADDRHPRPGAEPFLFGGESASVRRRRAE